MNKYPKSIEELDLDSVQFSPEVVRAIKRFAKAKPWRGTVVERQGKFIKLNNELAAALNTPVPTIIFAVNDNESSGMSAYSPGRDTIICHGRLSVVTFLHEWGHKLFGASEYRACEFSLALFRRCFPRSWVRLRFNGHMAVAGPTSASPERR